MKISEERISKMRESWKKRPDYLGEIKSHKLFNIWRSFKYTKKGKKIGNEPRWDSYKNFYNDIIDLHEEGKRFNRIDKKKRFERGNIIYLTNIEVANLNPSARLLSHKGEEKSLREWSIIYGISLSGLSQRYRYNHKNWTSDEVLFGRIVKDNRSPKTQSKLSLLEKRNKASKMISSYKISDKKHLLNTNLTIDWFLESIFNKECTYCGDKEKLGADRKDNNIGHTKDNCVPCCYSCNIAKGVSFSFDEMKIIGATIKEIKKNRNHGITIE